MATSSRGSYKRLPLVTSSQEEQIVRLRADAQACYAAAVHEVAPAALVGRALTTDGADLLLRDPEQRIVASHRGPVLLVGGGKAALAMARQGGAELGERLAGGGIVVPHGGTGDVADGVVVRWPSTCKPPADFAAVTRINSEGRALLSPF